MGQLCDKATAKGALTVLLSSLSFLDISCSVPSSTTQLLPRHCRVDCISAVRNFHGLMALDAVGAVRHCHLRSNHHKQLLGLLRCLGGPGKLLQLDIRLSELRYVNTAKSGGKSQEHCNRHKMDTSGLYLDGICRHQLTVQ